PETLVSASCHNLAELHKAQQLGADLALLSPVRATPKSGEQALLGWEGFADLCKQVSIPVYALGGVAWGDLETARTYGGQGVAGIRGFLQPPGSGQPITP
ncbi:MAG: thiamine phosphate synthase, partial [Gammaproteobacteria bacterium]